MGRHSKPLNQLENATLIKKINKLNKKNSQLEEEMEVLVSVLARSQIKKEDLEDQLQEKEERIQELLRDIDVLRDLLRFKKI